MSNARIFAPLDEIFRMRLDKNWLIRNIRNILYKKYLLIRNILYNKNWRSPIREFSLEKASLAAESFFKYIRFFIYILNLLLLKLVFFSFYLLFLNILSADIFARPPLPSWRYADKIFQPPPPIERQLIYEWPLIFKTTCHFCRFFISFLCLISCPSLYMNLPLYLSSPWSLSLSSSFHLCYIHVVGLFSMYFCLFSINFCLFIILFQA